MEKKALEVYHEDDGVLTLEESCALEQRLYLSKVLTTEDDEKERDLVDRIEASFISDEDVLYAGGQAERKKSSKNKNSGSYGFFSQIFGGKNKKNQGNEGTQ